MKIVLTDLFHSIQDYLICEAPLINMELIEDPQQKFQHPNHTMLADSLNTKFLICQFSSTRDIN